MSKGVVFELYLIELHSHTTKSTATSSPSTTGTATSTSSSADTSASTTTETQPGGDVSGPLYRLRPMQGSSSLKAGTLQRKVTTIGRQSYADCIYRRPREIFTQKSTTQLFRGKQRLLSSDSSVNSLLFTENGKRKARIRASFTAAFHRKLWSQVVSPYTPRGGRREWKPRKARSSSSATLKSCLLRRLVARIDTHTRGWCRARKTNYKIVLTKF